MAQHVYDKADDLPAIDREIIADALSDEEGDFFIFGEALDGECICLISQTASSIMQRRAQTIRSFKLKDRNVKTFFVTIELLTIIREQVVVSDETQLVNESELDKKFNEILLQAVQSGTSDIHLDIFPDRADLKFRIHGMINKVGELDTRTANRLINYIYNVAAAEGSKDTQYNPEEMQDALLDRYLDMGSSRKHYKLRLQTAPCYPNSISIIMRVLPVDSQLSSTLKSLGYSKEQRELLKQAQQNPTGAIIVAGTTGSGKSTTLATMLTDTYRRTKGSKKIITTEDPPEYTIAGANQINLSAKKNVAAESSENMFVKAIKVAMRSDPDIIMVGEVRDEQSSQLLSSAVLSGHQVFTTVHAASGLAILDRMINMGFDKSVITTPHFLSLLVYQCLIPISCEHCRIPYAEFVKQKEIKELDKDCLGRLKTILTSDHYKELTGKEDLLSQVFFANKSGCSKCRLGLTGRTVVAEMVVPTHALMEHVRNDAIEKAYNTWRDSGGVTTLEHAITKLLAGEIDPRFVEDKCGPLTNAIKGLT
jgi:general secretion pathway protein E